MSVYSTNIFNGVAPAGTTVHVTPPPDVTVVLRDVTAITLGGNDSIYLYFGPPGDAQGSISLLTTSVIAAPYSSWQGRQVIEPGGVLTITSNLLDHQVSVSGYYLS